MNHIKNSVQWLLVAFLALGLLACGGSDDDTSDPAPSTTTISGTAATGAAAAQKTVTVVDANGTTTTTITDDAGNYTLTVASSANPYMLKVDINGNDLFSFSESGGITNITPMTNLALFEANKDGTTYQALADLFDTFAVNNGQVTTEKLTNAKALVNAQVAAQLAAQGVDKQYDVFTTAFAADSTGIDAVLDNIVVVINGTSSITINGSAFDVTLDIADFLPNNGTNGSLSGTWDLVISGSAGGISIPNITINNYPATAVPTASSSGTAQDAFNSSFGAIGTVSNFSYTITSTSSTQVVARILGTVTTTAQVINGISIPGIATSYDLTYTYTQQ